MKGFLDYIPGNTVIHRLDPRTKMLLPLLICIGSFSCESLYGLLAILACDILLGAVGGIFSQTMRILKGLIKISLFLFVLQLLFVRSGEPLIPLVFGLSITDAGLLTAAQVVMRLICATLSLTVMVMLTPMNDLANALVQRCHVPYKYAFGVTSAIRFIPGFATDMQEIIEAQTARGVEFDTRNILKKLGLVFPLCVPLLISSVKKIDSAAIAAELRGFNLRTRTSIYKQFHFQAADAAALLFGVLIAAAGIVF